jgi:tol-pal system protein YbgF
VVVSGLLEGCASEADLIDTRLLIDKVVATQKKLSQDMAALQAERNQHSAQNSSGEIPAAAELTTQYDQLQNDLKTLKGQVEETDHTIGEIRQHVDEQGFQLSTLTAQMQTLQTAVASAVPPTASAVPPAGPAEADQRLVLPGRTPPAPKAGAVTPVEAYNLAYNDYLRGNYTLAVGGFEQFLQQYSSSILVPHAMYWLGESYFGGKQYQKAAEVFNQFMQRYPKHEKVPAAMLKNGLAYLEIGDKQQASQLLKRLVANYPTSDEANVAKGQLADLR